MGSWRTKRTAIFQIQPNQKSPCAERKYYPYADDLMQTTTTQPVKPIACVGGRSK